MDWLDILKAICAFCVVCIHYPFLGKIDDYIVIVSRSAVPVFFMITGFFYSDVRNKGRETAQILKITSLCLVSNAAYFLWGLFLSAFGGIQEYFTDSLSLRLHWCQTPGTNVNEVVNVICEKGYKA